MFTKKIVPLINVSATEVTTRSTALTTVSTSTALMIITTTASDKTGKFPVKASHLMNSKGRFDSNLYLVSCILT